MKHKSFYTMKSVCRLTGLKAHVIRAWESRYRAVVPKRTPTNRRVYCQQDIRKLKLLKRAVDAGHQISQVANAAEDELLQLASPIARTPSVRPRRLPRETDREKDEQTLMQECLQAVVDLEPEQMEQRLSEAAVRLTRRRFVEGVIVPMFTRIGELWASGRLKIIHEHMASNVARTILWDMLRSVGVDTGAPRVVVGTPCGQWHEMGALAAALASAEAGWRPLYVGTNLPAEELAAAVVKLQARCIGLSISHAPGDNRLAVELSNLRRYAGPDVAILIGGHARALPRDLIDRVGAFCIDSWQDVIDTLRSLAADTF